MATRQQLHQFGFGAATVTIYDAGITGPRLPTCKQVLRCYSFHHKESINLTKWECAKLILSKLVIFYEKANIPMISERKCCEKIIELWEENRKLRSIPQNRRESKGTQEKLSAMNVKLETTFKLWPKDAESLIKNPEDRLFLVSMMTDRAASFGSHDKVVVGQIKRKEDRERAQCERQEKDVQNNEKNTVNIICGDVNTSSSDNDDIDEYKPSEPAKKKPKVERVQKKFTGTTAFIPFNILQSPKLVSLATRMKITPAEQATYTKAVIEESGGNPDKVAISYSTADKNRRKVGEKIAKSSKSLWMPPKLLTVHWDSN